MVAGHDRIQERAVAEIGLALPLDAARPTSRSPVAAVCCTAAAREPFGHALRPLGGGAEIRRERQIRARRARRNVIRPGRSARCKRATSILLFSIGTDRSSPVCTTKNGGMSGADLPLDREPIDQRRGDRCRPAGCGASPHARAAPSSSRRDTAARRNPGARTDGIERRAGAAFGASKMRRRRRREVAARRGAEQRRCDRGGRRTPPRAIAPAGSRAARPRAAPDDRSSASRYFSTNTATPRRVSDRRAPPHFVVHRQPRVAAARADDHRRAGRGARRGGVVGQRRIVHVGDAAIDDLLGPARRRGGAARLPARSRSPASGTVRNCDGRSTDGVTRTVWMRPLNHDTRFCRTPIDVCPRASGRNATAPLPCSTPST